MCLLGEALPLHLDRPERGLIIVTGAGKRSEGGAPVLRPAVLKLLRQEFKPQLKAAHVCKDNKGRVIVPWQNIEKVRRQQHNTPHRLMDDETGGRLGTCSTARLAAADLCASLRLLPVVVMMQWIEGQHQMVQMLRRSRRKAPGKVRALITY